MGLKKNQVRNKQDDFVVGASPPPVRGGGWPWGPGLVKGPSGGAPSCRSGFLERFSTPA